MTPDMHTIEERMLAVGDGHTLYVQDWGNRNAPTTFLFLHGGPGSGCNDTFKSFFDGTRDHVIFFDQRGAGRSTPAGSLRHNTTQKLIGDINTVLDAFGQERVVLFGGSWGTCLALAYAIQHPQRVRAMILRGLFTGTQAEIDHLNKGQFRAFFPDVWERLLSQTPEAHRDDPASYHTPRILGSNARQMLDSAHASAECSHAIATLDDRYAPADKTTFNPNGKRIETHFDHNQFFMPDGYILDHARELAMPAWLIQGRYDMICPPVTAYELHKRLPDSQLIFTIAGHSGLDRDTFEALRAIVMVVASGAINNN